MKTECTESGSKRGKESHVLSFPLTPPKCLFPLGAWSKSADLVFQALLAPRFPGSSTAQEFPGPETACEATPSRRRDYPDPALYSATCMTSRDRTRPPGSSHGTPALLAMPLPVSSREAPPPAHPGSALSPAFHACTPGLVHGKPRPCHALQPCWPYPPQVGSQEVPPWPRSLATPPVTLPPRPRPPTAFQDPPGLTPKKPRLGSVLPPRWPRPLLLADWLPGSPVPPLWPHSSRVGCWLPGSHARTTPFARFP